MANSANPDNNGLGHNTYPWALQTGEMDQPRQISNSYTMGCPPVCVDNPRALASGLSYVQVDNPWYNYIILPTSV